MIPKLAIIIPYYKIDFFEETLQSAAAQTDKRFTLYIGNDASPKNPKNLIEKHFPDGNYKYYDYKENVGGKNLALQWERILENVTEEWFQILGDDDTIAENFVEEFYISEKRAKLINSGVIKTAFQWINKNSEIIKKIDYNVDSLFGSTLLEKKYHAILETSLSENIFKKSQYEKHKFEKIPIAWGTDEMAILEFSYPNPITYNRKPLVFVRIFENSISGSSENAILKGNAYNIYREKLLSKHYNKFEKSFLSTVFDDYANWCHYKKKAGKYSATKFFLYNGDIVGLLRGLRKIFYTRKIANS